MLQEIVLSEPLSRTEIADRLGLTGATVSRITRRLLDEGVVRELPEERNAPKAGPGRRAVRLDIDPRGGHVLGIGIGLTIQTVILTDLKNRVIAGTELQLPEVDDPEAVIDRIARESVRLIDTHVPGRSHVLGGFTMISGAVDSVQGNVLHSPYLGGWDNVPLQSKLVELTGIPMRVESLSNAIALAETLFGSARGRKDVLCTTCALGLGTGLVLNGRLVAGHNFNAGVIGLMEVTTPAGVMTTLDRVAGGRGVLQRLYGHDVELPGKSPRETARDLFDAIERDRAGDPAIAAIMTEMGYGLGFVTTQGVRFVAPEIFVIAGPLSRAPSYVAAARAALAQGLGRFAIDVTTSNVVGPVGDLSATCGLAVCEYLYEGTQIPFGSPTPSEAVLVDASLG